MCIRDSFACERHDGGVVGHAAADDDLLRRVAQRVGHERDVYKRQLRDGKRR